MSKQEGLERKVKSLERKVKDLEARGATHLHFHDDGCGHRHCHWCDCRRVPYEFVPTPLYPSIPTGPSWITTTCTPTSTGFTVSA